MQSEVNKTATRWRAELSSDEYRVLREGATEPPHTGEYTNHSELGSYCCRACGTELFRSEHKFSTHCGWPSFYTAAAADRVRLVPDRSLPGPERTEVRCAACDSHLGHVFTGEGYPTPTDQRWCINSISLRFLPSSD
jgi:peptide-methionine (R)-S-oxide reductase